MKVLDLFCGAGGFSFGLLKAGFRPSVGVDIDAEDGEGAFTPGHEASELLLDFLLGLGCHFFGQTDGNRVGPAFSVSGPVGAELFIGDAISQEPFFLLIYPALKPLVNFG